MRTLELLGLLVHLKIISKMLMWDVFDRSDNGDRHRKEIQKNVVWRVTF